MMESTLNIVEEAAKPLRYYEHWVFMKRNADYDYDVPPTVVASTCNVEEAIDIAIEADFDVYDEEKAEILRKMKVGELYMVTDDTVVWKTRSVRRRLIIWDHRQHYDRRMDTDNFMAVWKAFRKYIDYIENCYDNDLSLSAEEQALLRRHAPYQDLVFPEGHGYGIVGGDDGSVEDDGRGATLACSFTASDGPAECTIEVEPYPSPTTETVTVSVTARSVSLGGHVEEPVLASASAAVWNGAHTRAHLKRRVCMTDECEGECTAEEDEELLMHFKNARIGDYSIVVQNADSDEDL